MRIKRQLELGFFAAVLGLFVSGAVLALVYQQARRAEEVRTWATAVVRSVFECNMFGSEIAIQESERAREQYLKSSERLARLLRESPHHGVEPRSLRELNERKERMDNLVRRFGAQAFTGAAGMETQLETELKNMLASQILLHAEAILNTATKLREQASRESVRYWQINVLLSTTMILIVLAATAGGLVFGYRRILLPLEQLAKAARQFGAGELDRRVPVIRRDEIGLVSQSFNRMAEQLNRRQAELEERVRDMDTLCYSIAHDLKAPLRAVAGFGRILQEDYGKRLDEEGRGHIGKMLLGADRMGSLIDGLLQYGALAHRNLPIAPTDLESIWNDLYSEELESEFRRHNAVLRKTDRLPPVMGNSFVLRAIMANLVSNALKYGPPDGGGVVTIQATSARDKVTFVVADNGIGIAPEHQQKIFGLFERLHTREQYEGTGLGLAMAKKGIERLGGTISVSSRLGEGTLFSIELPAADAMAIPPGAPTLAATREMLEVF